MGTAAKTSDQESKSFTENIFKNLWIS